MCHTSKHGTIRDGDRFSPFAMSSIGSISDDTRTTVTRLLGLTMDKASTGETDAITLCAVRDAMLTQARLAIAIFDGARNAPKSAGGAAGAAAGPPARGRPRGRAARAAEASPSGSSDSD